MNKFEIEYKVISKDNVTLSKTSRREVVLILGVVVKQNHTYLVVTTISSGLVKEIRLEYILRCTPID